MNRRSQSSATSLDEDKVADIRHRYFDAINSMLNHQIEFSKACADIYKPISGRMSDPDSFVDDVGNPEGIRACEEYETIVHDLQSTLQPELELIETRIIRPADELLEVIKAVRKLCAKRDHKQLDYDRHRSTLKKLEDKKDKTLEQTQGDAAVNKVEAEEPVDKKQELPTTSESETVTAAPAGKEAAQPEPSTDGKTVPSTENEKSVL